MALAPLASACPAEMISKVAALADADVAGALDLLDDLLAEYHDDARLWFLRGSLLAAERRYPEAESGMAKAVEIDPNFAIARFQLGLLQFSSGDAPRAASTWSPLHGLDAKHPLRLFAGGLEHLSRDEWDAAVALLTQGIALNTENLPLNNDMRMVIDEIHRTRSDLPAEDAPLSSTQLLLNSASFRETKH